jgi:hypothetical protein
MEEQEVGRIGSADPSGVPSGSSPVPGLEQSRSSDCAESIQRVRRSAAKKMRKATEVGDHEAWERAFIRSQWAIDDINKEFWR